MIHTITITDDSKPTSEQIKRIREASVKSIVYDEDSPELDEKTLKKFKRPGMNTLKNKSNVIAEI